MGVVLWQQCMRLVDICVIIHRRLSCQVRRCRGGVHGSVWLSSRAAASWVLRLCLSVRPGCSAGCCSRLDEHILTLCLCCAATHSCGGVTFSCGILCWRHWAGGAS